MQWAHVPNEGQRHPAVGRRLRAAGMKAGVPDVLVFTPAPVGGKPVAIELKRVRGGTVHPAQWAWLDGLANCGWDAYLARGSAEAIAILTKHGY